jgi:hypothetical protein
VAPCRTHRFSRTLVVAFAALEASLVMKRMTLLSVSLCCIT